MEQLHLFENLISEEDAAETLGVHRTWLSVRRRAGEGPRYLRVGNRILYDPQDLDDWLESLKTQQENTHGE